MAFFRNKEIRKTVLLYSLCTAAATVPAMLWNTRFGLFTLLVCMVFVLIYLGSTYRRYRRLAELAGDIDRILHGSDPAISLDRYAEGELAILESEIQKMTVRLREQKQRLQEDKLYLADSIADISHQIRTPLTSINLLVQMLRQPDLPAQRKAALLRELQELLSRIDWMITVLLKISKLDAGTVAFKQDTVSLAELLKRATEPLLVPTELREQQLVIHADGCFTGDLGWTCEAVGNIVKNCMEHTPNGGTLKIHAAENALYAEITIEDTGTGIDKDDLPHIFERFYKGKDADDKSFGVGLALARMIVAKQNGTLKAENKQTGGALFTMRFYKTTI